MCPSVGVQNRFDGGTMRVNDSRRQKLLCPLSSSTSTEEILGGNLRERMGSLALWNYIPIKKKDVSYRFY
jgi:hypothetical protein